MSNIIGTQELEALTYKQTHLHVSGAQFSVVYILQLLISCENSC